MLYRRNGQQDTSTAHGKRAARATAHAANASRLWRERPADNLSGQCRMAATPVQGRLSARWRHAHPGWNTGLSGPADTGPSRRRQNSPGLAGGASQPELSRARRAVGWTPLRHAGLGGRTYALYPADHLPVRPEHAGKHRAVTAAEPRSLPARFRARARAA